MVCIGGLPERRLAPVMVLACLSSNSLRADSRSGSAPHPVRRGTPSPPVRSWGRK
jgi:hypothetical protein